MALTLIFIFALLPRMQALMAAPSQAIRAGSSTASNATFRASMEAATAAAVAAYQRIYQPLPPQLQETYMRYMPGPDMVVCGCGKCGTSSMYDFIYKTQFGQDWPYGGTQPYIHAVTSERWNNTWVLVNDPQHQGVVMNKAFSFAIVRDPQERLVSAWKSKIACGNQYHTDMATRTWMTAELLKLAGRTDKAQCMSLDRFLQVMDVIHRRHDDWKLDRHFLPQHLGCFYRFPPEEWSAVVSIDDPKAMQSLTNQLKAPGVVQLAATHASTSKVLISDASAEILERITKLEYKVFGEYLRRPSFVKSGIWV